MTPTLFQNQPLEGLSQELGSPSDGLEELGSQPSSPHTTKQIWLSTITKSITNIR